jgi:hypothetical protein
MMVNMVSFRPYGRTRDGAHYQESHPSAPTMSPSATFVEAPIRPTSVRPSFLAKLQHSPHDRRALPRVANISPEEARNRVNPAEQQYRQTIEQAKLQATHGPSMWRAVTRLGPAYLASLPSCSGRLQLGSVAGLARHDKPPPWLGRDPSRGHSEQRSLLIRDMDHSPPRRLSRARRPLPDAQLRPAACPLCLYRRPVRAVAVAT